MKLNSKGLANISEWENQNYILPKFNREEMIKNTKENPEWIHFGAGNIFRAFHAALAQNLLDEGIMNTGIVVAEGYDYEIIEKAYRPNDNLSVLVTLKGDGNIEKKVIGSIGESLMLDSDNVVEFNRLKDIFMSKSLKIATFTITEKGYSLVDGKGEILPEIEKDLKQGPYKPSSYLGKVAALLYARYKAGELPIAMVSTDNCSHNGDRLFLAMEEFATAWVNEAKAERGFVSYIRDRKKVSFPWSMIDKITPRPDEGVKNILASDNLENLEPVITSKSTYVAPFVNAEETQYLVIEDAFPAGKLPLDKAGVIYTDKMTVDKVEKMKVCTCLNPLHTALAVFGCLLGYNKISEEMKNETLVKLIKNIGYSEGLPVVVNPGVLDPKEFIDVVVEKRLPNPFMPDTPQRIATDTSQKLSVRFGETIKNYIREGRDLTNLKMIPLVFAGWLRYLKGIDDEGNSFELSPDPLLSNILPIIESVKADDDAEAVEEALKPVLTDKAIFGVNLYAAGMAKTVIDYYRQMSSGKGAVLKTLLKYVDREA